MGKWAREPARAAPAAPTCSGGVRGLPGTVGPQSSVPCAGPSPQARGWKEAQRRQVTAPQARPPPAVADMEPVASNIQVLLQAAEFLERREREAEHGYASLCPHRSPGPVQRRRKRSPQAPGALDSGRSVHNELEKRRRAQLKRCLEQLKQQMPLGADCARYTTLSLLRRARMHIQKLEEQEQRARRLKEKLRSKQQSLKQQLEQLRGLAGPGERERLRADSLDSSGLSSERSDSDQEELEVDVESLVFGGEAELLRGFSTGQEHSYSHCGGAWL
ncbi:max dimerization protein 3 isoform X1 [Equus przewalskii]|uniref:Max dimerization protein 3 n=2 Tax=Equus TaxID=9789 RepID=F6TG51_HORSE|nr:max dimerization protein 3 isoform X2 [Equus caballus]